LKLPTSDELHEARVRFKKDDDEEEEESDEDKKIEESRKFVEEETKFFDNNVQKHVEELKETQLERWKDAIMKYIEDSKALRVKEEQVNASMQFSDSLRLKTLRKLFFHFFLGSVRMSEKKISITQGVARKL
jgi:hypothetical protein